MRSDDERELRRLQARAYGPDADIVGDEPAMRRLHELESLHLRAEKVAPTPVDVGAPEVSASALASGADWSTPRESADMAAGSTLPGHEPSRGPGDEGRNASPEDEPAADARVAGRRTGRLHLTRPLAWAWSGSLVLVTAATAVVASVVTSATVPPAPMVPGARHEATLSPDESFSWPGMFADGTGEFFASYGGYLPISTTMFSERACLAVYRSADIDPQAASYQGTSYFGCGGGGFPASVVVPADSDASSVIGGEGALQFVLNGSVIEVYSDAEAASR